MYVCLYAFMYAYMCKRKMHICIYGCMYVCKHVCVYVRVICMCDVDTSQYAVVQDYVSRMHVPAVHSKNT